MPVYEFGPEEKRRRLCARHLREEPNVGTHFVIVRGAACDVCAARFVPPPVEQPEPAPEASPRKKK